MKLEKQEFITIFGAGSWGTALAILLAEKGHQVTLWGRKREAIETMQQTRHNAHYLSNAIIPTAVKLTDSIEEATQNSKVWVIATPSQAVRSLALQLSPFAKHKMIVVSVAKGIENETLKTTSEVLKETLPKVSKKRIGVLYGPSHAEEVSLAMPTTVVVSMPSRKIAQKVQQIFMCPTLRVYINPDLIGVEIAGSVKNVMAIAAGISDGLGYGDNAKAAILTRGMAEIRRLGLAMGAKPTTFAGLAGIGDLVVTCTSQHSRNRFFGEQIGKGNTLEEVEASMNMVAEGVRTTLSVMALAKKYHVEMPITEAVYGLLFEQKDPKKVVSALMSRAAKDEIDWLTH